MAVVECDLNGVKEPAKRAAALSQVFDELPVDGLARLVELACIQERNHRGEFGHEPAAIVWFERRDAHRLHAKDIDDLFAAEARAALGAGAGAAGPAGANGSGRFDERVDLALFNI